MVRTFRFLIALALASGGIAFSQAAAAAPRSPLELARAVETRASSTTFAELEEFGLEALKRNDREGLNRLYHVAWIYLNQGDFEHAETWNRRLRSRASTMRDSRYLEIARLNDLTIRYDQGDSAAGKEMGRIAAASRDWFVQAHATRVHALSYIDQGRIGDALNMLSDMDARIPDAPFASTAHSGIWEMVGMGLMSLNDLEGAATAFGRFEIDYADPAYPRPDFDSIYNLTMMAVDVGDLALADRLYATHNRLTNHVGLESLTIYDASLCATVAEAADDPRRVLNCLAPHGAQLGEAAFLAEFLLPIRAVAYARTGDVVRARQDLNEIRRLMKAGAFREDGGVDAIRAEAEVLFAEGRHAEAFAALRSYQHDQRIGTARRFSGGIHQVTGDMQAQLAERRRQLETAKARDALQGWIIGIGVAFLLSVIAALLWTIRSARELREAQRRAEMANRTKSEFLANMSHEIRTPLNGVVAMADALSRAPMGEREHEMVEVIRSSGVTLERLLSDILDSSKIESGQIALETAPFHLGRMTHDIAALWEPKSVEKNVALHMQLDPALDRVFDGDMVRIRQVLTNLVSNAVKFTEAGAVTIDIAQSGDGQVRFSVTDTGVGFDATRKDRVFGRFLQADGSITRRFGGTGLGLAISRDLVALMGGEMDCESTPGEGSRFWFDIPLVEAEMPETATETRAVDLDDRPLRILLADDHPANRKVVEVLLAGQPIELISVADGRQAVDAFADGGFDVVLMDMQMPVLDGLAATREIRALEAARGLKRTPVVMLTANAMAEHIEAGRAAGSDGHLAKPITAQALFAGIGAALEATGEPRAEAA